MTKAVELAQVASTGVSEAFKNRIINGAMVINQRYGTTSQTNVNGFVTDRFQVLNSSAGTVNAQTVTTAPAGFTYSTRLTVGTADASVGAADSVIFYQTLEGYNIADLNWGTANAKVATLSFWVYSSLTGNYSGSLVDQAGNYSYPFNYTISSANTWEQKSITIAAPTGGGTFGTTNDVGVYLEFSLMTGTTYQGTANAWSAGNFRGTSSQVNWMATSGNTWFITGVQLEVGSTATSFDYRSYGTELDLCRRYCEVWNDTSANVWLCTTAPNPNNTFYQAGVMSCYPKRVSPSITASSASSFVDIWLGGSSTPTSVSFSGQGNKNIYVLVNSSTNQGAYSKNIYLNAGAVTSNYVIVSAEL